MSCPYVIDGENEARERQLEQRSQLVRGRAGIRTQVLWIGGTGGPQTVRYPLRTAHRRKTWLGKARPKYIRWDFLNETHQGVISVQCTVSVWRVQLDETDGAYAVKPLSCSGTEHSHPPETSLVPLSGPLPPLPLAPGHPWGISKHQLIRGQLDS